MARLGLGFGRERGEARGIASPPPPPPPPPSPPLGLTLNGSTNPMLRAMLARVAGGAGRGRIVFKGDSTTAGEGAGDVASDPHRIADARRYRPSAVLASLLTAAGYPALDTAVVGDNGASLSGDSYLNAYDPRVNTGWNIVGGKTFAGGNFFAPTAGGEFLLDTTGADTLEFVLINSGGTSYTFSVDGAAPASVSAPGMANLSVSGSTVSCNPASGFSRVIVKAAGVGTHRWRTISGNTAGAVRGWMPYDGAVAAIDIVNHASRGATAQDQAASGNWYNNDALAFDAPDLTIVNLGLNNIAPHDAPANLASALQTIVDRAKLSGDVLLVFPHPGGPPFDDNVTAYRDAAAAVASASGVAFLSLFDYFGGAFTSALAARMNDGIVHGNAGFYAEVGDVYRRCIQVMAA